VLAVREGLPAELLAAHGVDADAARARVLELLTADTVNFSLGASGSSQSTDAPESAAAATARDSLSIRAATVPTMADVAAALAALPAEVASLREEIAALRAQLAGDPPRD
jgi:hypothetical protein